MTGFNRFAAALFLFLWTVLSLSAGAAFSDTRPLPLVSPWSNYGQGYAPATVTVEGGLVAVSGLVRTASSWGHIATLPPDAHPPKRLIFTLDNHDKSARVDVLPDGQIVWVSGSHDHGWLSLDGIRFAQNAGQLLSLQSGWGNYSQITTDHQYTFASASKHGNRVMVTGLVMKNGRRSRGETIATLPPGFRPTAPLIFSGNAQTEIVRLDVYPDGRIVWNDGGKAVPWVSLNRISFSTGGESALQTQNGWAAYGGSYAPPAASHEGHLVVLSGLVRGEGPRNRPILQLPPLMRPSGRLIFHSGVDQYSLRVDITADGEVYLVAGQGTGWLSLSGIAFPVPAAAGTPAASATPVPAVTAGPIGAMSRQALPLVNGWQNYAGGYTPATVAKTGNLVMVSGLVRAPHANFGHIATLPAGMHPPKRLIFNLNNHDKTARVDVLPNGQIVWAAGGHDHGWLSLTGITFSTAAGTPLSFGSGWRAYPDATYSPPTVTRTGDLVVLSGLAQKPGGAFKSGDVIAALPPGARPPASLIFNVNGHGQTQRVDISADGRIFWTNGGHDGDWVSLDGISFSATAGANLSLTSGFAPYGYGWASPQASRIGDVVALSGLTRPGNLGQLVMVLPSQYRPGGRMIFNLGSDGNPVRVDVLPNGEVRREAGPTAVDWVNLSGISFPLGIQGLGAPPSGPGMVSGKPTASDWIMALFKEIKDEVAEAQGEGAKLAADAAADLFLPVIQKASGKRWDLSLGFDLAKKNDSSSGEYWQADFKIGNQPFSVIVYRPRPRGGQPEKPHLAVVASQFKIANVLKDLEGTPIGELAVEPAAFVYMPLPKDGQVRTLSLQSDIPAPVRSMIQGTYTYKGGAAPANVTALPGQNLWALIKTQQAEAAGREFIADLTGADVKLDIGDLRVRGALGRTRRKDKGKKAVVTKQRVIQMVRVGTWGTPFGIGDTTITDATVEYSQWDASKNKGKRIRFWGHTNIDKKPYFLYGQRTQWQRGNKAGKGYAFALDSDYLSYFDLFGLAGRFGVAVLAQGEDRIPKNEVTGTILAGLDKVQWAIEQVRIESPGGACKPRPANPQAGANYCTDEYNVPRFDNFIVTMASPKEALPGSADPVDPSNDTSDGPLIIANGKGKVFGREVGSLRADIRRNGLNTKAKLSGFDGKVLSFDGIGFGIEKKGGGHDVSLSGGLTVKGFPKASVTMLAKANGFGFSIPAKCPVLPPINASMGKNLDDIKDSWKGIGIDTTHCLGAVLDDLKKTAEKVADSITSNADKVYDVVVAAGGEISDWAQASWEVTHNKLADVGGKAKDCAKNLIKGKDCKSSSKKEKPKPPACRSGEFFWVGGCRYNHAQEAAARTSYLYGQAIKYGREAVDNSPASYSTAAAPQPWWEIDLGKRVWVEEVVFASSERSKDSLKGYRMNGAIVALSDRTSGDSLMAHVDGEITRYAIDKDAGVRVSVRPGRWARYIRVFKPMKKSSNGELAWLPFDISQVAVLSTACNCPSRWVQLPNIPAFTGKIGTINVASPAASDISVGNGEVYVSRRADGAVFRWHQSQRSWLEVAAKTVGHVAAGKHYDLPFVGTIGNAVHRMGQKDSRWQMIRQGDPFGSAALSDVTYTYDGKLFAASQYNGRGGFWEYSSQNMAVPGLWHNRVGNLWRIDGTWVHSNDIWAVDKATGIWKRTSSGGWQRVQGLALDVGVGYQYTWVIGVDNKPWRYETVSGRPIGMMPGEDLERIAVTHDGNPWAVSKDGSVWAWCEGDANRNLLGNLCPQN